MQPIASSAPRAASSTAVTAGSTGRSPRLRLQAIRAPRASIPSRQLEGVGRVVERQRRARIGPGHRPQQQGGVLRRVRASGPSTPSGFHASDDGTAGTRPGDVRSPTTLQNEAGLRMLAPRSDPSANGIIPLATAAAAPPLLPPGVRVRSYGLRVAPKTALKVCEPAPNSGVFVLPMTMAPARRRRATSSVSAVGTWSR